GRRIADAMRHPYSLIMINYSFGNLQLRRGEAGAATATFAGALALCRDNEVHTMLPAIVADFGLAQVMNGELPAAMALLEDALDRQIYRSGGKYTHFFLLHAMGRACLAAGRSAMALACAGEADAVTRQSGEHAHRAYALKLLGDIQSELADHAAAEANYAAAMALAEPRGMRPLLADCHYGLARLFAAGDDTRSRAEERLAFDLYGAMGIAPPVFGKAAASVAAGG
ncbi:MAG TPA: hypothetical protein VMU42_11615, partial [Candidatus Sulfotelmatobacter sp.]|nr:hypothetical protein [Candidatus Sulfotelmatobacter sp.]